jgi:hypothetical protein
VPQRRSRRASCLDANCLDACSRSTTESPDHVRSHHHECRIPNPESRVSPSVTAQKDNERDSHLARCKLHVVVTFTSCLQRPCPSRACRSRSSS